ncbi:MAG: hypothetical protein ACJAU6_002952, partial [Alphaproteobacteria bacterium]
MYSADFMDYRPAHVWTMRLAIAALVIGALFTIASPQRPEASPLGLSAPTPTRQTLKGQLLVADPTLNDSRFSHTVIFIVRHDETGAFGLVINRRLSSAPASSIFKTPEDNPPSGEIIIHYGGPVEPQTAFVLHTTDYKKSPTIPVNNQYAVTQTIDILRVRPETLRRITEFSEHESDGGELE